MSKKKKIEKALSRLIYPGPGILEQEGEFPNPQFISSASVDPDGTITTQTPDGSGDSFPTDDGNLEPYSAGVVKFTSKNGGKHHIRPVADTDGSWASSYSTALPAQAVTNLFQPPDDSDGSSPMPYLQDNRETMVAFTQPGDDQILGVLYINQFGAYVRQDGSWVAVTPQDDQFNDTIPYYVNPGSADQFLALYDAGPVTTEQAQPYITAAQDGIDPNATGPDAPVSSSSDISGQTDNDGSADDPNAPTDADDSDASDNDPDAGSDDDSDPDDDGDDDSTPDGDDDDDAVVVVAADNDGPGAPPLSDDPDEDPDDNEDDD